MVPIGARSAVPVPSGFDGSGVALVPSRALLVQQHFGDDGALVQRRALELLAQLPNAALRRVSSQLVDVPAAYRLVRLESLVRADPSLVPSDPTLAVSEVGLRRVPVPVPTLPATPPSVCVVNGFDPRWGMPPDAVFGIPLRFDAARGWYDFDRGDALARVAKTAFGEPAWDRFEFGRLAAAYDEGYVLQPFRRALGSPWEHRFVRPVDRGPTCSASPAPSRWTDG